jgi:uncharacterized Zn finger protein (UPF0148 family)
VGDHAPASCPKCGKPRDDTRTSCATCGLAHARMAAFEQARDAVPEALTRAWQHALEGWDEKARHDELLRLVTHHDAYAWAAARYRERLRERAGDAVADRELARVRRAAEAALTVSAATRQAKTREPYRSSMAILALLMLAAIGGLVYAMVRKSEAPPASELRPPGSPGATK